METLKSHFHSKQELGNLGELSCTCTKCGRQAKVKEADLGEGWRKKVNVTITHEDGFGGSHKAVISVADLIRGNEISPRKK